MLCFSLNQVMMSHAPNTIIIYLISLFKVELSQLKKSKLDYYTLKKTLYIYIRKPRLF